MSTKSFFLSYQSVFTGGQEWHRTTLRDMDDKPIILVAIVQRITDGLSAENLAREVANACGYTNEVKQEFFHEVPKSGHKREDFLDRVSRETDPETGEIIYTINGHRGIKDDTHD